MNLRAQPSYKVTYGLAHRNVAFLVRQQIPDAPVVDCRSLQRQFWDETEYRGRNARDDDDVLIGVLAQKGAADRVVDAIRSLASHRVALIACNYGRHRSVAIGLVAAGWAQRLSAVACQHC